MVAGQGEAAKRHIADMRERLSDSPDRPEGNTRETLEDVIRQIEALEHGADERLEALLEKIVAANTKLVELIDVGKGEAEELSEKARALEDAVRVLRDGFHSQRLQELAAQGAPTPDAPAAETPPATEEEKFARLHDSFWEYVRDEGLTISDGKIMRASGDRLMPHAAATKLMEAAPEVGLPRKDVFERAKEFITQWSSGELLDPAIVAAAAAEKAEKIKGHIEQLKARGALRVEVTDEDAISDEAIWTVAQAVQELDKDTQRVTVIAIRDAGDTHREGRIGYVNITSPTWREDFETALQEKVYHGETEEEVVHAAQAILEEYYRANPGADELAPRLFEDGGTGIVGYELHIDLSSPDWREHVYGILGIETEQEKKVRVAAEIQGLLDDSSFRDATIESDHITLSEDDIVRISKDEAGVFSAEVNPDIPEWVTSMEDAIEELHTKDSSAGRADTTVSRTHEEISSGDIEGSKETTPVDDAIVIYRKIFGGVPHRVLREDQIYAHSGNRVTVAVDEAKNREIYFDPDNPDWQSKLESALTFLRGNFLALSFIYERALDKCGHGNVVIEIVPGQQTDLISRGDGTWRMIINSEDPDTLTEIARDIDTLDLENVIEENRIHRVDLVINKNLVLAPERRINAIRELLHDNDREGLVDILHHGQRTRDFDSDLLDEAKASITVLDNRRLDQAVSESDYATLVAYATLSVEDVQYATAEYAIEQAAAVPDAPILFTIIHRLESEAEGSIALSQLHAFALRLRERQVERAGTRLVPPPGEETRIGVIPRTESERQLDQQLARIDGPNAEVYEGLSPSQRLAMRLHRARHGYVGAEEAFQPQAPPRAETVAADRSEVQQQAQPEAPQPLPRRKEKSQLMTRMRGWVKKHPRIAGLIGAVGVTGMLYSSMRDSGETGPTKPVPVKATPDTAPGAGPVVVTTGEAPSAVAPDTPAAPGEHLEFESTPPPPRLSFDRIMIARINKMDPARASKRILAAVEIDRKAAAEKGESFDAAKATFGHLEANYRWKAGVERDAAYIDRFNNANPREAKGKNIDAFKANKERIARAIEVAAQTHGVDPLILWGITGTESTGNPDLESSAGAKGLMGIMKIAAKDVGAKYKDMHNIEKNVDTGAKYIAKLIRHYEGKVDIALLAYNWGYVGVNNLVRHYLGLERDAKLPPKSEWDALGINIPNLYDHYIQDNRDIYGLGGVEDIDRSRLAQHIVYPMRVHALGPAMLDLAQN